MEGMPGFEAICIVPTLSLSATSRDIPLYCYYKSNCIHNFMQLLQVHLFVKKCSLLATVETLINDLQLV